MVKRLPTRLALLAVAVACAAAFSCGAPAPDEPDYLRVVVGIDTAIKVPDEIDGFTIEVVRGGKSVDTKEYDAAVVAQLAKQPDSLIIHNPSPSNDSPEKQLETVPMLTVRLTAKKGDVVQLTNAFTYRFNGGKLQVGLPMCAACLGQPALCGTGTKCKRGSCVKESEINSASDNGALLDPLVECK